MKSLRRALLVHILGGLLVVLLLAGVGVFAVARSSFRARLDDALAARARTFASLVVQENGELELDYEGADGSFRKADLGVLVRITADDGEVVATSPDWPSAVNPPCATMTDQPLLADVELDSGDGARVVVLTAFATRDTEDTGDEPLRAIVVELIGRTDAVERDEMALLAALVAGGLFAAAGTALAVWVGIGRGLVPVRRLEKELDGIDGAAPAGAPAAQSYPIELRPIIAALDALLERVRAAMERERRFTDAAAHELRTPIAELKLLTDVADRWPEPERLRRSIVEARSIADEMEALIECLLAVARGASADASQATEQVALLPLARGVAAGKLERLRARRISCALVGDEAASWNGPRGAILAIVRNLIDNAAEYTPEGGAVKISATIDGGSTRFEVENGPASIEPSETECLFEPFWRGDSSRTDRAHRGLGLAIVASLAEALGLRRHATITPDRLLRVALSS